MSESRGVMSAGVPSLLTRPASAAPVIDRRRRLLAVALDVLALLPPLVVTSTLTIAWLLARTGWGREDVRDLDSAIAVAILGAAIPAWIANLAFDLVPSRATRGQRAVGLRIETAGTSMLLALAIRLASHPTTGTLAWAWLAGVFVLAGAFTLAALAGVLALVVAVAGLLSLAMLLVAPGARGLHDRIAGTRLASR